MIAVVRSACVIKLKAEQIPSDRPHWLEGHPGNPLPGSAPRFRGDNKRTDMELRILSVFKTIDGEANVWGPGHWSVFVRTAGCGVGCHWCDTKYSWNVRGGESFTPEALLEVVKEAAGKTRKVTLTGGEPLEQNYLPLMKFIKLLIDNHFNISVETAGTINTIEFRDQLEAQYPSLRIGLGQLTFVVDYKLKSSRFRGSMDLAHFANLKRGDVVKFVVGSEDDFNEAVQVVRFLDKQNSFLAAMYFSPQDGGEITFSRLFSKMKEEGLDDMGVGYNLQMHKVIFPRAVRDEEEGGVDYTKRTMGREEFLRRLKK